MSGSRLMSVCLPVYDMGGRGTEFLRHNLEVLCTQTLEDFDVVISDYSKGDSIRDLCTKFQQRLDLNYFRNTDPVGGMSANVNNAMKNATGQILKILFQDDYLYNDRSLEVTAGAFDLDKDFWLMTGCTHTRDGVNFFKPHFPRYDKKVAEGRNTLGAPTVLTIRNEFRPLFDVNLRWLTDCEYYTRCYKAFGRPTVLEEITAVIRMGDHQITNTEATQKVRLAEREYVAKKAASHLNLNDITLVAVTERDLAKAIRGLESVRKDIDFPEVLLFGIEEPPRLPKGIVFRQVPSTSGGRSEFITFDLGAHIQTPFALILDERSVVANPQKWTDGFTAHDYVGRDSILDGEASLRSKRMLDLPHVLGLPRSLPGGIEDFVRVHRHAFESNGMKFASTRLASLFASSTSSFGIALKSIEPSRAKSFLLCS